MCIIWLKCDHTPVIIQNLILRSLTLPPCSAGLVNHPYLGVIRLAGRCTAENMHGIAHILKVKNRALLMLGLFYNFTPSEIVPETLTSAGVVENRQENGFLSSFCDDLN